MNGSTTPVTWTVDASNVAGQCQSLDTDPWYAIPAAPTKVAKTTAAGAAGQVDLVFGVRLANTTPPGTYQAAITVEALAPDA